MGIDLDTIGYFLFMEEQEEEDRATEDDCGLSEHEQQNVFEEEN